jgi:glycosyltransferase involved in cell wall biosynthesis
VLGAGVAIARTVHAAGAGVAVPPETSAVAAALESIIGAGSERRSTMGPRARHLAATEFSADVMARRLIALYEDVRARTCRDAPGMPGTLAPARRSPEAP